MSKTVNELLERIAVLEATLRGVRKMLEVPVCGFAEVRDVISVALGDKGNRP